MKEKLVKSLKNNLIACSIEVPCKEKFIKRIKGFHGSRRSTELFNADPVRKRKRKREVKRNRMTYVSVLYRLI